MDQHIFQFTPSTHSTVGYLEVTPNGELKLLNLDFTPLNSNVSFIFKDGEIIKKFDEALMMRKTHPCNNILKFGLFALAATTVYVFRSELIQIIGDDLMQDNFIGGEVNRNRI